MTTCVLSFPITHDEPAVQLNTKQVRESGLKPAHHPSFVPSPSATFLRWMEHRFWREKMDGLLTCMMMLDSPSLIPWVAEIVWRRKKDSAQNRKEIRCTVLGFL